MVQTRDYTLATVPRNDFWKLDSGEGRAGRQLLGLLESKRYLHESVKSVTSDRLRAQYVRYQRGLLSYEYISAGELRLFATQRGILPMAKERHTVPSLKAVLEQADYDATFDRFSDLPAEMRQHIFKHYFNSFRD